MNPIDGINPGGTMDDAIRSEVLEVVSHCPQCGSPVYGRKTMRTTDPYGPGVRFTCSCRLQPSYWAK